MICSEEIFAQLPVSAEPSLVWIVDPNLPYFNGHFPQSPILPAIAIVEASTYILQRFLQTPQLALKSVVVAKFMSPIIPQTKLRISWVCVKEGEWQFEWKEESSARLLASLSVRV